MAKTHGLSHSEFLEQLLSDEAARRDGDSAARRARAARLDPHMVLEAWDDDANVTYDHAVWSELISMRFVEETRNAFILGPVGVGKTFMATALGHIACRRRISVHFERAEKLHKRLKAARLDASHDTEMRKLIGVDLLIIRRLLVDRPGRRGDSGRLRACGRAPPRRGDGAHVQQRPR